MFTVLTIANFPLFIGFSLTAIFVLSSGCDDGTRFYGQLGGWDSALLGKILSQMVNRMLYKIKYFVGCNKFLR